MWNLGFADVTPDPSSLNILQELFDQRNSALPFACVANSSQITVVRNALKAVESKQIDDLSSEERQAIRGLMFAPLKKPSSLSKWLSLSASLFFVHLELKNSALDLTNFAVALKTSSVRHLSLRNSNCSFRYASFFDVPSLRSFRCHWVSGSAFEDFLKEASDFASFFITPFKDEQKQVWQGRASGLEFTRPDEQDKFGLARLSGDFNEIIHKTKSAPRKITPLKNWFQKLGEIAQATPSLTEVYFEGPAESVLMLPGSSIQKFDLNSEAAGVLSLVASILPKCPLLTELNISEDASPAPLIRLLPSLPSLSSFNLVVPDVSDEDWTEFAKVLPQTRFSTLSVICPLRESTFSSLFCPALPELKNTLTTLRLTYAGTSNYIALGKALAQLDNLRSLEVGLVGHGIDGFFDHIAPSLSYPPLVELSLFFVEPLQSRHFRKFGPTLSALRSLRYLSLHSSEMRLTSADTELLIGALPSTTRVLTLVAISTQFRGKTRKLLQQSSLSALALGSRHDLCYFPDDFKWLPDVVDSDS
jgi:hypothetical protein